MVLGDKYVSDETGTEILKVHKIYANGKMASVQVGDSNRAIICRQNTFDSEPSLCLAHIFKDNLKMRRIKT